MVIIYSMSFRLILMLRGRFRFCMDARVLQSCFQIRIPPMTSILFPGSDVPVNSVVIRKRSELGLGQRVLGALGVPKASFSFLPTQVRARILLSGGWTGATFLNLAYNLALSAPFISRLCHELTFKVLDRAPHNFRIIEVSSTSRINSVKVVYNTDEPLCISDKFSILPVDDKLMLRKRFFALARMRWICSEHRSALDMLDSGFR